MTNLKFCFKLGKTPKATYVMLVHVHEDQELSLKCVYEWLARFREGRESVSHKTCSGRPASSINDENIENVRKLITKNRQLTVSMIAAELQINRESVPQIATHQYRQTVPGKKGVGQIDHPPYSPDLNPTHFFLFPRLKLALKGKRFDDILDTQRNMTKLLISIPKEVFLQNLQDLYNRSPRCIVMGGDYFEGRSFMNQDFGSKNYAVKTYILKQEKDANGRILRQEKSFIETVKMQSPPLYNLYNCLSTYKPQVLAAASDHELDRSFPFKCDENVMRRWIFKINDFPFPDLGTKRLSYDSKANMLTSVTSYCSRTSFIRTFIIRGVKYPDQFFFQLHVHEKDFNDDHREEITDFVQSIPGFQQCDEDVETWKSCEAEDCGFQKLNDDEIVTPVQEKSDPVDDETDEDEDNNESSNSPSNADAFSALETAMEWYEQQSECCPTQLLLLKRIRDLAVKKRRCTMVQRKIRDYFPQ
ncbi:protein GVQW3 [Trichonephila clavipes]|nr:protein GVQW3 [Trichonephila clavipes]